MEEFSTDDPSAVKRDKKNLLLSSKDPHLSHLFGDDPKTPNSMGGGDMSGQSVMEDSGQFHDEESSEPEYRLFEEQSYVPDLSPSNQMVLDSIGNESTTKETYKETQSTGKASATTTRKVTGNGGGRSNGPAKTKPFQCKEPGCTKSYVDVRSLQKHVAKLHSNDVNNNSVNSSANRRPPMLIEQKPTETIANNTAQQSKYEGLDANYTTLDQQQTNNNNFQSTINTTNIPSGYNINGQPSSDPDVNLIQSNNVDVMNETQELTFASQDNSHYNMQLLAHSAQHLLQNQPETQITNQSSGTDYIQHQSSSALQQLAMRVQMRTYQGGTTQENISSAAPMMMAGDTDIPVKKDYLPMTGQITGVRAQLRKSLSSSGKLENVNVMAQEWPRMQIPVDRNMNSSVSQNYYLTRAQSEVENDSSNIDNAPLLKNLLETNSSKIAMAEANVIGQENGGMSNDTMYQHSHNVMGNSWPGATPQNSLQSPVLVSKRSMFQYQESINNMGKAEQCVGPQQSPLNSPTYVNPPQFPVQHNQTTPLPQANEQQFFAPDNIMVNNNNNQQMVPEDESVGLSEPPNLNEMIKESENLVDLMEAEANSNQGSILSFADAGQSLDSTMVPRRATPPPAYHLDPNTGLLNQDMVGQGNQMGHQMYMAHNQIKSEPQSPMLTSPMAKRMFFNQQSNHPMGVHSSNMQPLSSPTTPIHTLPMQPTMQPPTPTGDAQWQFPMSGQQQNYVGVPQSPMAQTQPMDLVNHDNNLVQNINYLPHTRQPNTTGNPKQQRNRRPSGNSGRKNPDGTLSCTICGHSFRSVPALNGHMRVHSSSNEKKNKDERQRKASGSSSGGNGSKTPQSLSSPTTPTFNNKVTPPTSMYQNAGPYNNVNVPAYNNTSTLYNPTLSNMEGTVRDSPLVHRLTPGLYPYALQHVPPPTDALLAAANLFRSETDLNSPYMRTTSQEEYQRQTGNLQTVPDLQNIHLLARQQSGYRSTPPGMILFNQPGTLLPSYLQQNDHSQPQSIATVPFVTLPMAATSIAVGRQSFPGSPQEQNSVNSSHLENVQYLQQPLIQQTNHRSTPLADFADIAVLHNQGQLFSANSMHNTSSGSNSNQQPDNATQQLVEQQTQHTEPIQMQVGDVSSDAVLLDSMSKELLWRPDAHSQSMAKMERDGSLPLKEDDFLPSSMVQMHKTSEQMQQQQNQSANPFIFPVSVPVPCSRDDSAPVTSTTHSYYPQHFDEYSNNMPAFHDDPLMQEAINVANPSTILPNSMMGGNPSGLSFRSFRQRHHSEGSILKKTWQPELQSANELKPLKSEMLSNYAPFASKTPPATANISFPQNSQSFIISSGDYKRKGGNVTGMDQTKKIKLEHTEMHKPIAPVTKTENPEVKKEVWTVPKQAPPNRQRHRRHSADSRLPYRSGSLFSRSAYLSSCQMNAVMAAKGAMTGAELREKRRPPPLIIPPSVNAYSNGTLYTSHLHHRRRPSGDSASSCGNDKIPPYTPPPMLSPLRFGTGLYYTTPGTPSFKPLMRQTSTDHHGPISTIPEEDIEDEDLVRSADPKINIGSEYQAELPKLRSRRKLKHDVHKAELIWKPTKEVATDNSTQSRHVEEYMKLACSAAVPYGGCNKEFALHLLHKNNGDILSAVRQLLKINVKISSNHWMSTYRYTGSSRWQQKERQTFERATMLHHKDFYQISKIIGTKTTGECVDYYYHCLKRRKRRIQRPRRFRHDSEEEENVKPSIPSPNEYDSNMSDENDFMQDYVVPKKEEIILQPNVEMQQEHKNLEVIKRSPPLTTFINAAHVNQILPRGISNNTSPPQATYSQPSQHIPQMHTYARLPVHLPTEQIPQQRQLPTSRHSVVLPYECKFPNCNFSFPTSALLAQHQNVHKPVKPYLDRINQASPSPASSPGSVASADTDAPQFQCPRCGKTFAKVKSRNAHMKTHGKLAQEKRRQKEEEQKRKMEEAAAAWRNRTQPPPPPPILVHHSSGKPREFVQFQAVASPLTKPNGM
uniref:uncharacterized protein LOC120331159 n=1 Tax=Styela clava TaxID=7725 RepID=UPI00193A8907|nr:uncharacterized protein LOC120331159 [Styela clava]